MTHLLLRQKGKAKAKSKWVGGARTTPRFTESILSPLTGSDLHFYLGATCLAGERLEIITTLEGPLLQVAGKGILRHLADFWRRWLNLASFPMRPVATVKSASLGILAVWVKAHPHHGGAKMTMGRQGCKGKWGTPGQHAFWGQSRNKRQRRLWEDCGKASSGQRVPSHHTAQPTALLGQTSPLVHSRDREQGDCDLTRRRRQMLRAASSRPPGYLSARKAPQARSTAATALVAPSHGPGWSSVSPSPVPSLRSRHRLLG